MDLGDIVKGNAEPAVVHQPKPHDSGEKHVTGEALYIDDLREPAGTLHAVPGYAPVASGRVTKIDLEPARQAPGVVDVLTADDIPGANDISPKHVGDDPAIARDRIEFFGQVLFVVLGETREQARRAARMARISTAPTMPVIDVDDAIVADTTVLDDHTFLRGEPTDEIAKAPKQLAGEFRMGGQEHFYLEGQVALAIPGEGEDMFVHSSTQHPSEVQQVIAHVLSVDSSAVTVEVRRMGGAFGGKESQATQWAALAAVGARKTGRPVKLRLDRDEDMIMTGKRHDFRVDYNVGFSKDGVIRGVDVTLAARCGFSEDLSFGVVDRAMFHADGCYYYPTAKIRSRRMRTNTVSNTAFRGFGGPQGKLFAERMIDHIAYSLGRDPLDVRKANLYGGPGRDRTPYNMRIEDSLLPEIIDELERTSDYRARRKEIAEFNSSSPVLKRGLALTPVKFGISFTLIHLNQAGALVHVYKDGSVSINHGGTEMGQGLYVKIAQVVAEEFGIDLERVKITATVTDKVPNTAPTAASSGTDLNAQAAIAACKTIKERLFGLIQDKWNVGREQVQFRENKVVIGNEAIEFGELAHEAFVNRVSLSSTGFYRTPKIEWDREKSQGRPFYYFAYGAACSEVTVDTMTGEMRVSRVDILHDVGKSLNPAIDIGQIEGGFVQGMGWLTTEELVWDSAGQLKTHAPSTYKIPTASDVPENFRVSLFDSGGAREDTIYRSKAVGEPPLMLAISVFFGDQRCHRQPQAGRDATPGCAGYSGSHNAGDPSDQRQGAVMRVWRDLQDAIVRRGGAALVTVVQVQGSAPREAGTRMIVNGDGTFSGTIGGGTLEWQAIALAQKALADPEWRAGIRSFSLGPDLGQCCGGRVELIVERFSPDQEETVTGFAELEERGGFATLGKITGNASLERSAMAGGDTGGDLVTLGDDGVTERFADDNRSLMLFGAGHVGRALVLALAPLDFKVTWLDPRAEAFPAHVPGNVSTSVLGDPGQTLANADADSFLAVMTHSHALDQTIVEGALKHHDFPYVGLIGSATKRARFTRRLREADISEGRMESLVCPIGATGVRSKAPAAIAAAIAVELLLRDEAARQAETPIHAISRAL